MYIVNPELKYEKASLVEPNDSGYIHLAAEVDGRPYPFKPKSKAKKTLIDKVKVLAKQLEDHPSVRGAYVYNAIFMAPGIKKDEEFLKKLKRQPRVARFDFVLLVETTNPEEASALLGNPLYKELETTIEESSRNTHKVVAENARKIEEVDKSRQGVFLFNYFYANDEAILLDVWEYTAGWFTQVTGLDNSTLLRPITETSDYTIINHARWDRLIDFMPHLIFRRTLQTYVAANFKANDILAQPILYRLV